MEVLTNVETKVEKFIESEDTGYLQIASVNMTENNPQKFSLDMAHSEQSKKQQDVAHQQRRTVFFTTQFPFPFLNNRILITETTEVILSPLENAVQLVEQRVKAIEAALLTPQVTVLSGLLYGNLMTTIAEGPEAICKAFLPKKIDFLSKKSLPLSHMEKQKFRRSSSDLSSPTSLLPIPEGEPNMSTRSSTRTPIEEESVESLESATESEELTIPVDLDPKMVERLKELLKKFVKLSEKALDVHESLMDASMREWQNACKERFIKLRDFVSNYV